MDDTVQAIVGLLSQQQTGSWLGRREHRGSAYPCHVQPPTVHELVSCAAKSDAASRGSLSLFIGSLGPHLDTPKPTRSRHLVLCSVVTA